jgi:hypothetical protein
MVRYKRIIPPPNGNSGGCLNRDRFLCISCCILAEKMREIKKETELETHEIRRNPSISAGNYSGEKHVSGPPRCQVRS